MKLRGRYVQKYFILGLAIVKDVSVKMGNTRYRKTAFARNIVICSVTVVDNVTVVVNKET